MTDSITQSLAEFVGGSPLSEIPTEALSRARDAITDGVGVAIAGTETEAFQIAFKSYDEDGQHRVIGCADKRSRSDATLLWGIATHALDFDDTAHPAYCHPTAVFLPTLVAVDNLVGGLDRERILPAYVIGIEVVNVLGRLINLEHYQAGWHATATIGTFGATAVAAAALGANAAMARTAFSIAASMAGGVRGNFGSMVKPLHAGLAARNAVEATLLAKGGFKAADEAIGGRAGFLMATNSPTPKAADINQLLGPPWEIESDIGLALKPYPACGATHPGVEAAGILRQELDSPPRYIRVGVNSLTPAVLTYSRPENGSQAKFSMEYCIAAALKRGRLRIDDFEDHAVRTLVKSGALENIHVEVDDRVRDDGEFATIVTVETELGSQFEKTIHLAAGKPSRWPTEHSQRQKFDDCLATTNLQIDGAGLWKILRELGKSTDLSDVVANATLD